MHHRLFRALSVLAFVCLLAACASGGGTTALPPGAPRPPIAVVSLVGDTAHLRYVGTTIFNNAYGEVAAGSWGMDQALYSAAVKWLAAHGREVVGTTNPVGASIGEFKSTFMGGESFHPRPGAIPAFAESVGAGQVLVIGPLTTGDPFFLTTEALPGYDVAERSLMGIHSGGNYIRLNVELLDGATGKRLASGFSNQWSEREERWWIENENLVLEGANATYTRDAVLALVPQAVGKALESIERKL